jgi:hypothetical protein
MVCKPIHTWGVNIVPDHLVPGTFACADGWQGCGGLCYKSVVICAKKCGD